MADKKKVVLAYSGGLDTSYCVLHLQEQGFEVITLTVDTGGFSASELSEMEARAKQLGAAEHHTVDARAQVFDEYVSYQIKGNILRGQVYPLAVAAERVVQASVVADYAIRVGAAAVAHGSTGAGNDQVRFDVVFQVLCPALEIISPVRDETLTREEEYSKLAERGVKIPDSTRKYSINTGLWGGTIGGGETHDSWAEIPDHVYDLVLDSEQEIESEHLTIEFEKGIPTKIDDTAYAGPELISVRWKQVPRPSCGSGCSYR